MGFDAFPQPSGIISLHQTHLYTKHGMCWLLYGKKSPRSAISWEGFVFRYYPNSTDKERLQTDFPGHNIPALERSTVLPQLHRGFFSTLYLWFPTGHEAKIQMDSITWKQPRYTPIPLVALWQGNVELPQPTALPGLEYRPRVNRMALTANPRSFPYTGKSRQELEQQIQREKP